MRTNLVKCAIVLFNLLEGLAGCAVFSPRYQTPIGTNRRPLIRQASFASKNACKSWKCAAKL